ncbi:MAG: GNAT family N-acetyltransferase [Cytophagales bacterium]|nr:GNAT family N-acetyltransferase [Cytophagales bacterium]
MNSEHTNHIKLDKLGDKEIDKVVDIWYRTSVQCHDFVEPDFWHSCKEDMREKYIPNSETYVAKYRDEIAGFISLAGDQLAAIFVLPEYQGMGIGQSLLHEAFRNRKSLMLNVFEKNQKAKDFYLKNGFEEVRRGTDEHTGESEIIMQRTAGSDPNQ